MIFFICAVGPDNNRDDTSLFNQIPGQIMKPGKALNEIKKRPHKAIFFICGVARAGVFFPDRYGHNGTLAGFVLFGGGV